MPSTPPTASVPKHRRRVALAGLAAALGALAVPAVAAASSTPASPAPGGGDYCQAHLDLVAAFNGDDPSMIGPAVEAATAAVPPEIADALATALANAPTDGPPSPEFNAAYEQVASWIKDNCGFNAVEVLATEYAYGGLPTEIPAGPTVITLVNDGVEVHEMVLMRRADGVTDPVEDLLALPDEELGGKVQFIDAAFAYPGESGSLVADLAPGNYIAICFLPIGNTPDQITAMLAGGGSEAPGASAAPMTEAMDMGSAPPGSGPVPGAPHFTAGMIQEFTVTGGAPTTTG